MRIDHGSLGGSQTPMTPMLDATRSAASATQQEAKRKLKSKRLILNCELPLSPLEPVR